MNALQSFARQQERHDNMEPQSVRENAPDLTPKLEEMYAFPDCFENWLDCPHSVAGLLSLILDSGLPSFDQTERDDVLRDLYYMRIQSAREDFDTWAQRSERGNASPVDQWIKDGQ